MLPIAAIIQRYEFNFSSEAYLFVLLYASESDLTMFLFFWFSEGELRLCHALVRIDLLLIITMLS